MRVEDGKEIRKMRTVCGKMVGKSKKIEKCDKLRSIHYLYVFAHPRINNKKRLGRGTAQTLSTWAKNVSSLCLSLLPLWPIIDNFSVATNERKHRNRNN